MFPNFFSPAPRASDVASTRGSAEA